MEALNKFRMYNIKHNIALIPRIIKLFVGELSGIVLFNSTCAPVMFIIPRIVSPPTKNTEKKQVDNSSLASIYNNHTVKPPVNDHPNCQFLVVAYRRSGHRGPYFGLFA